MSIEKFEDIIAWKKSFELTKKIYEIFRACKDYSFRDQLQRAVVSIMNNIAEGFERKGNKEFVKFLYISKGSCAEVRSMCYLAYDLKFMNKSDFDYCLQMTLEISKILSGLIKTL